MGLEQFAFLPLIFFCFKCIRLVCRCGNSSTDKISDYCGYSFIRLSNFSICLFFVRCFREVWWRSKAYGPVDLDRGLFQRLLCFIFPLFLFLPLSLSLSLCCFFIRLNSRFGFTFLWKITATFVACGLFHVTFNDGLRSLWTILMRCSVRLCAQHVYLPYILSLAWWLEVMTRNGDATTTLAMSCVETPQRPSTEEKTVQTHRHGTKNEMKWPLIRSTVVIIIKMPFTSHHRNEKKKPFQVVPNHATINAFDDYAGFFFSYHFSSRFWFCVKRFAIKATPLMSNGHFAPQNRWAKIDWLKIAISMGRFNLNRSKVKIQNSKLEFQDANASVRHFESSILSKGQFNSPR